MYKHKRLRLISIAIVVSLLFSTVVFAVDGLGSKGTDQKEYKGLSNEEKIALYKQGYSYQYILVAEKLAYLTDKTPKEILDTKGKKEYKTETRKNEKGEEIEVVVDTSKTWDTTITELGITLEKAKKKLKISDDDMNKMQEEGYSEANKIYIMVSAWENNKTCRETIVEIKEKENGNKKENTSDSTEYSEDEKEVIEKYNLTAKEIEKFKENGIEKITDMAFAKNLAKKYGTSTEKIIEKRKQNKKWEEIQNELGGISNDK
jgi:phage FluMu protein Com